ncbi:hypothetical protein [Pantoea agglomerans]|uniref:hypothetical protein n=1 Tax=Enterobacter agglomerans TaxID=549 RepID=UPI00384E9F4C
MNNKDFYFYEKLTREIKCDLGILVRRKHAHYESVNSGMGNLIDLLEETYNAGSKSSRMDQSDKAFLQKITLDILEQITMAKDLLKQIHELQIELVPANNFNHLNDQGERV